VLGPYFDRMIYQKPKVVDYGKLTDVTAQQQDGNFTDRDFPQGTPKDELTFS
jgi:hypothetical protein